MRASSELTFAEWYRSARPGLLESVVRAVANRDAAGEAVDEACARAFERWERVAAMRSPTGWVFRVAVNAARRQARRSAQEDRILTSVGGAAVMNMAPPADETWLLVDALPPRQRAAVVLRHVAGLTEREVGERMGIARSTVSATLAAAYKTLSGELGGRRTRVTTEERLDLKLAIARRCDAGGCDVEYIEGGEARAAYSEAVKDKIKVRPGDLVAVNVTTSPAEVAWRWWHGTVVAAEGDTATVSRNVTQRTPGAPRTAEMQVRLPADLAGDVTAGMTIYWTAEDDEKVAVALAEREHEVRARLDDLQRHLQ